LESISGFPDKRLEFIPNKTLIVIWKVSCHVWDLAIVAS
jgi:hypothetical protein